MRTIYNQAEISRAGVARKTGLTRPTVSSTVAELIEEGLVAEVGQGPSDGGKPPILLRVVADSRHLLAIDLANRNFQGGVFDLRGAMIHRAARLVDDLTGEAALQQVFALTDQLIAQATRPILGIGIGTPGLIDIRQGAVRYAVNLDWTDLPLCDLVQDRYNLPVYVVNDAQAAALAEYSFGDYRGTQNLVVVKVGRGVSAGLVLNGQLYEGANAGASEIGHVQVIENGEPCLCGHYGCLETVASSRVLVKRARAIAANPASQLHRWATSPKAITTDLVLQAFEQGDQALKDVIDQIGHSLGIAVSNLVGVLNVQDIFIAGSLARFGETLLQPIRFEVSRRTFAPIAQKTKIRLSSLGQDHVLAGAVALLLKQELALV